MATEPVTMESWELEPVHATKDMSGPIVLYALYITRAMRFQVTVYANVYGPARNAK